MRINVTRSDMPDFDEFCEAIRPLWDSRLLTNNGSNARLFSEKLSQMLGVPHAVLFSNGHLALEAILSTLPAGGEVITTPFTFASTTHALVRKGLKPVFADIREADYTLDPDSVRACITPRTVGILPVHVYGLFCDVEAFDIIGKEYGIPIIYDAAHTFGETYKGKSPAEYGSASMFSFHATKVFHSIEGGCAVTKDSALCAHLERERNFGIEDAEHVCAVGGNAKMNEFQAIMGLLNLKTLPTHIEERKKIAACYNRRLNNIPGLRIPPVQEDVETNCAYYPLYCEGGRGMRNRICDALAENGIFARKYFYPLITDFDCYRGKPGFDSTATPVAGRISDGIVTLPLYSELPLSEAEHICSILLGAL